MQRILREIRPTLTLALPITIGQLSQMLMGITDSLMIGHTGTVPLAASSFGGNIFGIFYVLGIGLMVPVSVLISHARGAGQLHECGEYLRHGLALAVGFGLIETVALGVLAAKLSWFGQTPEVLALVNPFFLYIGASITPVLIYLALRQFAESMGRPWVPMMIMLASVALNAGLNWIFIYGHFGAPAMGLAGAGLATLIARVVGVLVLFEWVRRDSVLKAALPEKWWGRLSWPKIKEMLRLGLPASGMLGFENGAFAAAAVMMGWLSAASLAAHQIAIACVSTTFMFMLGLSLASGMRISAAVGAGERDRLRPIGYGALIAAAGVATVCMMFYLFAGPLVASWFVRDPAVIVLAAQLLVIAALFQLVDGAQVIVAALLRGLKDVTVPTLITFVAYWGIAIGGGYWLGIRGGYGATAIWWSLAAGLGCAAVFLTWRFRRLTA